MSPSYSAAPERRTLVSYPPYRGSRMKRFDNRFCRLLLAAAVVSLLVPAAASAGRRLVRIPAKGPVVFEQLNRPGIEILAVDKYGIIDAVVDDKLVDYVFSLGYPVSSSPIDDVARAASELDSDLGMYHTFAEMESVLTAWEATWPAICDVFTIGSSVEGRPIYAIKISDNVATDETGEAEVLFIGNHHARELMSVDIPLRFAGYLLENYTIDATVASYVDNREIYFVPMLNPDGHVYVENNHAGIWWGDWWRKNRSVNPGGSYGVDLNRNYDFYWGSDDIGSSPEPTSATYRGPSGFSEPETQAIRDLVNSREFTMWMSYHSYGEMLLYPWGYIAEHTPDHRYFKRLGELLTETNGYVPGNTLEGPLGYIVNGDSDDWGYGEMATKNKIFAFTPEVNSYAQGGFGPSDTLIAPTFDLLLDMNMRVLEYCADPYSVVGPFPPSMYAIADPYHPVHTLSWTGPVTGDLNPSQYYEVERCTNPGYVSDPAESMSPSWVFDGFSLGTTAHTGSHGYYSGSGDQLNQTLAMDRPFVVDAESDTFTFWASYTIETDWDYAYVDVSADFGETWTTVAGNITTTYDPNGNNRGHGITGSTPGWTEAKFPLTAWLGTEVRLRISYITDAAVVEHGIDVDDLGPVAVCGVVDMVASSVPDTLLQVFPAEAGTYRYRVQGIDDDGDTSGWSNSQTIVVTSGTATGAEAPLTYQSRLSQNHPNPFNPVTTIPYIVGGPNGGGAVQRVTLRVYDVSGRLVATLVDEDSTPGRYEAAWQGRTDSGKSVLSGVYFYRLTIGERESFTRKLLLLK